LTYTIVTTFHEPGLQKYAQRMIDTFDRYWPQDVKLRAYAEDCDPMSPSDRIEIFDLHECCPSLVEFKQRHRDNPVANGEVMKDTGVPYKDNHFKWDAVRFSNKVFAVIHASLSTNTDWMIWLDADTLTFDHIPPGFLDSICDPAAMACYLGRREKYHSECGWVAYNLRHPDITQFMQDWKDLYVNDTIFDLREYHDSFVFDVLRRRYSDRGTRFHNLTPVQPNEKGPGHPFIASPLGRYMDHLKGDTRKDMGKSQHRGDDTSYQVHQGVGYWQN
jgi:hypothetical protein